MTISSPEIAGSHELTPEQQVERYAELLLTDSDGNERGAIAEHLLAPDAEPGNHSAQARFFRQHGGYTIVEYRNGDTTSPVFTDYMYPFENKYPGPNPQNAKWATGMIRH